MSFSIKIPFKKQPSTIFSFMIVRCRFEFNEAFLTEQPSGEKIPFFGGGAFFATYKNLNVRNSSFYVNKSPTSAIKVYNKFPNWKAMSILFRSLAVILNKIKIQKVRLISLKIKISIKSSLSIVISKESLKKDRTTSMEC